MLVFIEYFCLRNFIIIFFHLLKKKLINSNVCKYYYIDSSFIGKYIIVFLKFFHLFNLEELKFKFIDIKDSNQELIRLRLTMKDTLEIQNYVVNNEIFTKLYPNINKSNYFFEILLLLGYLDKLPKMLL